MCCGGGASLRYGDNGDGVSCVVVVALVIGVMVLVALICCVMVVLISTCSVVVSTCGVVVVLGLWCGDSKMISVCRWCCWLMV